MIQSKEGDKEIELQGEAVSYQVSGNELTAPAYGVGYRLMIAFIVIGLLGWGGKITWNLISADQTNSFFLTWIWLAYFLIGYMGWVLFFSVTTLNRETLSQGWFWRKSIMIHQVSYVKFMRWRGLEWLIAPRLLVRTGGGGPMISFHAYSSEMWDEFEKWESWYQQKLKSIK